jgi:dolichol kinase
VNDAAAGAASSARPTNVSRTTFHVASGVVSLALLRLAPERWWLIAISGSIAASGYVMEISRRRSEAVNARLMRLFSAIAHPHERHRVNSSTWYVSALLLMAIAFPLRAAELGVIVLALADPAAGIVGRKWGRTSLRANRSLEGTITFALVAFCVSVAWMVLMQGAAWPAALATGSVVAAVGAAVELVSTRIDDNFGVPVGCAVAAAVMQRVLGGG